MDIVRGVRAPASDGLVDIRIDRGRISAITPAESRTTDQALLVMPGLVDSHLHLEKAYLLDRMAADASNLAEAIAFTSALKRDFTAGDILTRARRVLDESLSHGVTHVRCHVEIDDTLGLLAMKTILALKEEYANRVTLNVVAFPQEGIFVQRTTADLMEESMRMGADAVGGIPYNDRDVAEHLDFVFELAARFDKPLDLHIDLSDDPGQLDVLEVIERTRRLEMEGRVSLGHLTSLGSVPVDEARRIAAALAQSRISVITLPVTDAFLNGRADQQAARRGLTPVRLLLEEGVNVAVATNNIQNPFTPFGRGNILDVANLLAVLCHLGSAEDASTIFRMLTSHAASAIGLTSYGLEVGADADFALYNASSARDALLQRERPMEVYKRGRLVAQA
ncbi:amidohydrolase family protein [Naasia lichenicola]|uniref:amidohydrolase family protein n=1 Tax=Naasia lichenicola TaxID=2565933 RepID=UPI00130D4E59|nr:amidohydrolase family protein [Naasia lichenicola]